LIAEAVYTQFLEGPLETDCGSLPGVVPLNSSQMVLTEEAQVPEMVAVLSSWSVAVSVVHVRVVCLPAEVWVDAGKDFSVVCLDVLDDDRAGDGVLAVTASTVELAKVHGG
jgi:hypothetical protein